jgi:hypothetical protein
VKKKIKKEIIFLGIFILFGIISGALWAVLESNGVITPPANEREIDKWVVWVILGIGFLLSVGTAIVFELLKKVNKKYEIQEKDERNQAIYSKAGYKAWLFTIFIFVSSGVGLFIRGHSELVLIFGCLFLISFISWLVCIVYYGKKM